MHRSKAHETKEVDSGVLLLPFSQCEQELNLPADVYSIYKMRFNEASRDEINRANETETAKLRYA